VASTRTEALVLRSVDFGESDRILHLLVPGSGRLTAIAKAARRSVRRFGGTLDLFNHLKVQVWQGGKASMARLEQAQLIEAFASLRVDPARFGLGCYLLELLDRLAPEGGARADMGRLFAFALAALRAVAARPPDTRLRLLLELRALDALGLRPELSRCVRCGAASEGSSEPGFHVADGGVVCGPCGEGLEGLLRVHRGTLRALEQGLRFEFDRLDRLVLGSQTLVEAEQLLGRFQRFHVGVELRSERFLDEILHRGPTAPAA
jgi:DNA repair protein RecO (recombination protein O)